MTAFALSFADGTTLAIDGAVVTLVQPPGAEQRQTFESVAVAMVAFEANATAFERGVGPGRVEADAALPGSLADLSEAEDRTWIRVRDGELAAVNVYDADPVGYWDGLHPDVLAAPRFGAFVPDDAAHEVLGAHALRRLLAHPKLPTCVRFGIEAGGKYIDPLLDRLVEAKAGDRLTHLFLYDPWDGNRGESRARPRPLGDELPRLRMLYVPFWTWPMWGHASFPTVDRLTLGVGPQWVSLGKPWPCVPPLAEVLDDVARKAPALRKLAFWHRPWTAEDVRTLATHPIVRRLTTLELFNVHAAFDHDAVLAARGELAHLQRVVVGSHLLPREVMARFADWSAVVLASYDRRELRDHDASWQENEA